MNLYYANVLILIFATIRKQADSLNIIDIRASSPANIFYYNITI